MSLAIACDGPRCDDVADVAVPLPNGKVDSLGLQRRLAAEGWTTTTAGHFCADCTLAAVEARYGR